MPRKYLLIILLAAAGGFILISPGCDKLVTETIETTIAGNPTAEFTITPDSGCIPLQVNFEDASSGPVRTWVWNFGDGALDTLRASAGESGDVSHSYSTSGAFTVTLTVFDSLDGSDAEVKKRAVIVGHNVDSVHLSDTLGCPGQEFTFRAFNPYGVVTWNWAFGDGVTSTDSSLTETHTYVQAGVYQFKLTVTGACGQKELIDTVHILNCARPYFTADPDTGCVTFSVAFLDSSLPGIDSTGGKYDTVGNIVHWSWNFGNGTTRQYDQSTDTIDAQYTTAGSFPVTLTVTTDSGGVTSYSDTIVAFPSANADFTAAPVVGCQTLGRQFLVSFRRDATGDTDWIWDFGDGDSAFTQNPYHAYTNPGIYTVTLAVRGACGADITNITKTNFIHYSDQLGPAAMSFSKSPSPDTLEVTFVDESSPAAVLTRFWTFDGVAGGTADTVVHTFDTAGAYVVKLTRFNDCDSVWKDSVIIVP